ncbi:hypothetical protein M514_07348 [Trichuris suis]|uniref:Uncharacterized protein n=1 Tax=Trichuris suis TaxID=68888 RepID=A0A085NFW8_9BILA|nr:hypothetical protein M513_07348 [Trichuris suis]KFD68364.1 hypothetical protein M514_07348 [Trichuris suis]
MDCARGDCAGHRTLWKESQNATHFRNYLKCIDDCVKVKLQPKEEKSPPPAPSSSAE